MVISACCCNTFSIDLNDCKPTFDKKCLAVLCGQTGKSLTLCLEDDQACCICPLHGMYDQILTGPTAKEDVCCILCHKECALVKPYCLSGEKPCCKGFSDGCCCQTRKACPCDADVPSMYAMYGIKCCNCAPFAVDCKPCAKLPPLSKSFQTKAVEVAEAQYTDEYLICAGGCCMCSMYIPETYSDAFGATDNSLCCFCYDNECKGCMLPKDTSREEPALLLGLSGQGRVIKPPIMSQGPCCKGVTRVFCSLTKFAFPCDAEVPFVVAVCGNKLCERTIHGKLQFGDDKKLDPATGKKPLFAKIQTVTPMSVKATANSKKYPEVEDMERS